MKTKLILTALACTAIPAFAGPPPAPSKAVIPPPEPIYGVGWYGAIQAGINAHQNVVDADDITIGDIRFSFEDNSEVGFFVGGKLGYVFGTGTIRPALELDAFYNHFEADVDVDVDGGDRDGDANLGGDIDSGAFLLNFLVKFGNGRCQPYVGGGVGVHTSELNDAHIEAAGVSRDLGGGDATDFAWQLVGGVDYYFTEKFSMFLEYKWLNYEGTGNEIIEDRIDQHLIGLGARIHF